MSTFNVCYLREYIDPECESETFSAYETIYRNVPIKYLKKFSDKKMKMKLLKHCDWNYKDMATNYTNVSNIEIVMEKDYYTSFADIFADSMAEHEKEREKKHMWTDYGQSNDRQSLRKDFNPKLTKSKVYSYNGEKCH
tara:strand:+ start:234 stop:647 length:414 start_codon:yes stop_codon:yes gene_type:complete